MQRLTPADTKTLRELRANVERSWPEAAKALARVLGDALPEPTKYVTTTQAALILGVTPQTVRNWIDRGWLNASRPRPFAHRRIAREDMLKLRSFRAEVSKGVSPRSSAELDTLLSRHREDRQRARTGEPLAGPSSAREEATPLVGSR
jgi:excisionase family DNA binding protein